jgi:hypothetical protein
LLISSGVQKIMAPLKKMIDEAQEMTQYYYYLRNLRKLCYKKPAHGLDRSGVLDGTAALQGAGLQEVVNSDNKSVQAAERV